jgi:hypothetical protein
MELLTSLTTLIAPDPNFGVIIQDCDISDNGEYGVLAYGGGSHQLLGNTIEGHEWDGVRIADKSGFNLLTGNHSAGVWLEPGGLGNTIGVDAEGNTINYNDADGIHADIGDLDGNALGLTITDNTLDSNGGNGIALVTDTTLTANPNYGTTVSFNEIDWNTLDGMLVDGGGSHQVANNMISDNKADGIHLDNLAGFNTIATDTITTNGGDGIGIAASGSGNSILGVVSSANTGDGIHVGIVDLGGYPLALTVDNSTIEENNGDGLDLRAVGITLDGPSPNFAASVTGNIVSANEGDGVRATGGVHVLAGNTVTQNWGDGVRLDGSSFNALGAGNWVHLNLGAGLDILGGYGNTSRQTEYAGNGGLGIAGSGAPAPVLTEAHLLYPPDSIRITGHLDAAANASYVIELFGNEEPDPSGYGEGELYLGSVTVTTDASGHAAFDVTLSSPANPAVLDNIAATATRVGAADPRDNQTSGFSNSTCPIIDPPPGPDGGGGTP